MNDFLRCLTCRAYHRKDYALMAATDGVSMLRTTLFSTVLLLLVFAPMSAHGGPSETEAVLDRVERLQKQAMDDYDSLEFETAQRTLQGALAALRDVGLDESPAAAACYMRLGIVYVGGFKERNRGLRHFVSALEIDPTIELDPAHATPELKEVFQAAIKQITDAPRPRTEKSSSSLLEHEPVDEVPAGRQVTLRVHLGSEVHAASVLLYYRSQAAAVFLTTRMIRREETGDWTGVIPASAVTGKTVQYYIEARDGEARPIVAAGTASSPYIIAVVDGVPDEVAPQKPAQPTAPALSVTPRVRRLFVDAQVGAGIGIQFGGNRTEVAVRDGEPVQIGLGGIAFAPFHLNAEFGVRLSRGNALSLLGRFQLVTAANTVSADTQRNAVAGLLRWRYQFRKDRIHPHLHVDVGAGRIRHTLDLLSVEGTFSNQEICPTNRSRCIDTVSLGLLLVGAGAGLWYDIARFPTGDFGLVFDVQALAGIGVTDRDNPFALNFDLTLGVGVNFF